MWWCRNVCNGCNVRRALSAKALCGKTLRLIIVQSVATPQMQNPSISFLICTRNRSETVKSCVLKLLEENRDDFEVIVRDNCSDDNTLQLLNEIIDKRLTVVSASTNQGTLTFHEITKIATGDIITWLSDEDDFIFREVDWVLELFRNNSGCNVAVSSIVVGRGRRLEFPDAIIADEALAHRTVLSFSGCGGVFIRRAALPRAHCFEINSFETAYALWNHYPVSFCASRCLTEQLCTTSRVFVVQARSGQTTHNWSQENDTKHKQCPHYYPESVLDRLTSNIINIVHKDLSIWAKARITALLIKQYSMQTRTFLDAGFVDLLRDNYSESQVQQYIDLVKKSGLESEAGCLLWFVKTLSRLPQKLLETRSRWRQALGRT